MAITEAQKRATAKWRKEKTDEVRFRVPEGERIVIQAHAKAQGETFILLAYTCHRPLLTIKSMRYKHSNSHSLQRFLHLRR